MAAADFNGDGIPDVLSLPAGTDSNVRVFLGQLDGTFADSGTAVPAEASSLAVTGDFDGNGSQDVAILLPASNTVLILLNKNGFRPSSTALSQSTTSVVAGQVFNLSAIVSGQAGTPGGNVTFKQAGVPQATAPLAAGAAQATITAPSVAGQYSYTALYTGDGTFSGSLSRRLTVSVGQASTTTRIASSIQNAELGQTVTFTASVKPEFSGTPGGTVQFFADGQPLGTSGMNSGQALINVSSLAEGTHTIEAQYSGDSSFITSVGLFNQKVGKAGSTTSLASSLNPAVFGQPVTVTATVTDTDNASPTGFVVFSEGATVYGTVNLTAGIAQIALPQLPVGQHTIVAQYSGDAVNGPSTAKLKQQIQGAATTTSITSDVNPSAVNQAVTFTALVTSTAGTPDGTITFKSGSQVLGAIALTAGQAQLTVSTLKSGAHTITAAYGGGSEFAKSQGSMQQVVTRNH